MATAALIAVSTPVLGGTAPGLAAGSAGLPSPLTWGAAVEVALPSNAAPVLAPGAGNPSSSPGTDTGGYASIDLSSVACTSVGDCTAVGSYVDSSGRSQVMVVREGSVETSLSVLSTGRGSGAVTSSPSGISSVRFGNLANRTLAQSPIKVSATATSGLAVSFATTTPLVCHVTLAGIDKAAVKLIVTGTCTVKASQPGNKTWQAARPVSRSFRVLSPCHRTGA